MRIWIGIYNRIDAPPHTVAVFASDDAGARAALAIIVTEEDPDAVYDITDGIGNELNRLVNVARARVRMQDGTDRWRIRQTADVLHYWSGDPINESCTSCGQRLPTA